MYNIAYGTPASLAELSELVCRAVPGAAWREAAEGETADLTGDPKRMSGAWGAYDTSRLRSDTPWRPMPLDAAIADYVDWVRRVESA